MRTSYTRVVLTVCFFALITILTTGCPSTSSTTTTTSDSTQGNPPTSSAASDSTQGNPPNH